MTLLERDRSLATLAAMLAKISSLKVAIFEKEFFPREHIGESMIPRLTMLLERSGALHPVAGWSGASSRHDV